MWRGWRCAGRLRPPAWSLSVAALAGVERPWPHSSAQAPMVGRCWPAPTARTWRRSCSPAAPPACPRAWSTVTATSSARSSCWAARSAWKPVGWTCRPSRPSRCSIRRWA
ncbi:hypothetical protein G6F62_015516 [Rhizopus arrhizus]|nr:hypothetical protein G6F62_015516 [Rhizopus arrhizus]